MAMGSAAATSACPPMHSAWLAPTPLEGYEFFINVLHDNSSRQLLPPVFT